MVEHPTFYRTRQVDGLSIFYREAGSKDAPVILLLHGLPSSSRMFQPFFARLSDSFHLVAPDYPGFGHSDWPDPKNFVFTFDHLAEIIRSASKLSLSRTPSRITKVWGRTGKRGGNFGKIARRTKNRFGQISYLSRQRGPAMLATILMLNVMIPISGVTKLRSSTSPGRRTFKAICSTTIGRTWMPIRNGRHGCAKSSRVCWSSGVNTTCPSTSASRNATAKMCQRPRLMFSMPAIFRIGHGGR